MLPSAVFRSSGFVALTVALVLAPVSKAAPPSAPPLIADANYPNLFYGAVKPNPPGMPVAPVVVFVHGLGGSYVDWIEANNCPNPLPVGGCKSSPTSPGLGSANDMYDYAYQAGFRTVFLSTNADNSGSSSSIQTDSAMLQTLFPAILSHFGVSQVFFVAHSKGGLDLQDAIANPQWIGIASAVIEIGTPNQGDALADWCFSPAGAAACAIANLNTPGVQSMEIAPVQQMRAQWDPIFQNARVPFYTLSGNTYACGPGQPTCPTAITGPILTSITGASKAPANDGLVTYPETLLPTTYAMELGVIPVNHYMLRMGDSSFNYINAHVLALANEQPGVTQVATGGFGDQHNTWAWSMAWFNNMLYVGTGRETYCVTSATTAIQLGSPSLYPPGIGDCTPDYHNLPLQAEIWQYNPATNLWTMVFQSPNSLSTVSCGGKCTGPPGPTGPLVATARDIGFRGLTVVNEPGGVQALYAGGVTSGEIFECNPSKSLTIGCVPQGSWPPPRILRTTDGVNWNPLPQNGAVTLVAGQGSVWTPGTCGTSPCFLGSLTANGVYTSPAFPNFSIRSAAQLCSAPSPGCLQNGTLFLQVGDFPGVGRVITTLPGVNPALGDNCPQVACYTWASPPTATLPIWILDNFNNSMYAGTGSPSITGQKQLYGVWSTNGLGTPPYTWNPIITQGGFAQNLIADYAMSMEIFTDPTYCPLIGCLYVGTDRPNELVRIHPDTTGQVAVYNGTTLDLNNSWDLIVGNPRAIPAGQPGAGQAILPLSGIGQYFANGFTGHFWRMGVGSKGLYMGTWDWSSDNVPQPTFGPLWSQEYGTDVWRTPDGVHWTSVSKVGLGDGRNTGSRSFAATPFGLFMGTARSVGGTQVFNLDNGVLDFNKDGVVDQRDVSLMQARLNTKAQPNDPMDLNRDGKITLADVRLLTKHCTYPQCAVLAGANTTTLTPPVAHSAAAGSIPPGTVSLSWSAVSGAMDYLVYRITCSPSETTPPPAGVNPQAAAACSEPGAPSICSMSPHALPATSALFGYPSAPEYLVRVSGTVYSETAPNTLQTLYFVIAEDSVGNVSSPSNVVGGPSLAAQ
ncbi:MAG TPA: dockerin type I domain-containing protein [Bryobacteraceae bacterium]|nr:dockerin type I domain-containing protein [Bryobacteraceae bacterium]